MGTSASSAIKVSEKSSNSVPLSDWSPVWDRCLVQVLTPAEKQQKNHPGYSTPKSKKTETAWSKWLGLNEFSTPNVSVPTLPDLNISNLPSIWNAESYLEQKSDSQTSKQQQMQEQSRHLGNLKRGLDHNSSELKCNFCKTLFGLISATAIKGLGFPSVRLNCGRSQSLHQFFFSHQKISAQSNKGI